MGRKRKYNDDFPLLAEDYARRGMIDKEIARKLGISRKTFYVYVGEYRDFRDALKRGKAPVDVEVENALLKRAKGFEYEEVMVEYKPGVKKKGDEEEPGITKSIKKTKKLIVADVTAQIVWLTNRRPDLWKHRRDVALSGNLNIKVITAVPRPKDKKAPREKILPREKKALEGNLKDKNE